MVTRSAPRRDGPVNPSRAAGAPAPASAAATAPMAGARGDFYAPSDSAAAAVSALAGADFTDQVRAEFIELPGAGTADAAVAERAFAETNGEPASLEDEIARIRSIRRPLGAFSQKLALAQRPGYHRHWFNDVAGRIDEAAANGWAHVTGKDGKPISRCVGTGRDKGSLYAFAMEIPEVFWQEDQDARNDAAAEKLDSLKRTPAMASPGNAAKREDKGKFYDPKDADTPIQIHKS